MCRICDGEGCLNCERDPFKVGEQLQEHEKLSEYDFETSDYVCTRCNGAGCTKCEE